MTDRGLPPVAGARGRVLSPVERISEVIFGLIMALTFTCTLSVASAGREDVRTMLLGALGCNLAWGIVDGVLFVVDALVARTRGMTLFQALRRTTDPEQARTIIGDELPPVVTAALRPGDFDTIRERLAALPEPRRVGVTGRDFLGATGVLLLCFFSTFPVAVPFVFVSEPYVAMRISNAVALVMLFLAGYALARYAGGSTLRYGAWSVGIGVVLVGATIALGG